MGRGRNAALFAVLIASIIFGAYAEAGEAKKFPPNIAQITHGSEITAASVGPEAAGYAALKTYDGGVIKDGGSYAFAKDIAGSATYDGFKVNGPHVLIEGAAFTKSLDISTSRPVVMRGVSVRVERASPWAVLVRPGAGPFLFLWSDAGAASTDGAPHDRSHAMSGALQVRSAKAVVFRSHISKTSDGIDVSGTGALVQENLIDDLTAWDGDHNDGIQLAGDEPNIAIIRNKILNPNPQTSCVYILGKGVTLDGNYFGGGGWTIYGGGKSNGHAGPSSRRIRAANNIFGRAYFPKSGHFGPLAYWDTSPELGNQWRGNRFEDGQPVNP